MKNWIILIMLLLIGQGVQSQCTGTANNSVDLQSVSIDPQVTPIKVGQTTLIGFQINNNDGGTTSEYIPAGEAISTISYPANIISINLGTMAVFGGDYAGGWEVVPGSEMPGSFKIRNAADFPKGMGSIVAFEVMGTNVGGSDLNLGLNSDLDFFNSNCGDINNNQVTAGTIYVEAALPVELTRFTAEKEGGKAILEWTTAVEINNDYFEVLRSVDGNVWETIGMVNGAGTTTVTQVYEYVDDNPYLGVNYYRLEQFDLDGSSELSDVRKVIFEDGQEALSVKMYPNPTAGQLRISANQHLDNHRIVISDIAGKILMNNDFINGSEIDLQSFNPGMFLVRIFNQRDEVVTTQRVIKTAN